MSGKKRKKNQNENICLQQESNKQPPACEAPALDRSAWRWQMINGG